MKDGFAYIDKLLVPKPCGITALSAQATVRSEDLSDVIRFRKLHVVACSPDRRYNDFKSVLPSEPAALSLSNTTWRVAQVIAGRGQSTRA